MNFRETITSPANPRVRDAARLRDAEARRTSGLTLVDGLREIRRAIASGTDIVDVFVDSAWQPEAGRDELLATLAAKHVPMAALARRPFDRVAFGGRNEGLVAVARFKARGLDDFSVDDLRPIFIVEGVEKPGNLGAILRTCDAAGVAGVVACGPGTDPANPAVIRASLGTVFTMPLAVATTPLAIEWCASRKRRVIAAMPDGRQLWHEAALTGSTAILLGSEAHGVSPVWQDAALAGAISLETVRLPMQGVADSLNVAAAAAVLAYETLRQRPHDGRSV